ncbi:unnamed protein product [Nezara viridula]|uniref:Uncharacterized protein n=1 Tax=Nezara viridula TaxID=85310 RepID=A0A9P0H7F1_NEZVI|nr:unnamed protein product [Nezara viridula]
MEAYSSLGKDRVSVLLSNIVQTKMSLAVGFASRASIYDAVLTAYELSTAQCIVLALLHGLVNNDVSICSLLGTLSSNVQHLRSSYLKVWLKEDFKFDQEEIYRAFSTAAHFINAGLINVPCHVLQILASIVDLYNVVNTCKEQGDKDTLNLLESLGLDIGNKSSSEDDSPAATAIAEVVREENVDSSQPAEVEIAEEDNASSSQAEPSRAAAAASVLPQTIEEYIPPFQDYQSDDEEYDDNFDSSEYDALFSDEDSLYSDSNVDTPDEEGSDEMNSLSIIIELTQDFVDSGILESTAAQLEEEHGKTLLHRAAEEGSVRAIKALLRVGVDVDSFDQWRRTPAHVAATSGKLQALRALYHHGGADLELVDNRGDSLLHSAADRGHTEVVRWLLRHGVDVEVSGRGGWRPLHRASQQGHLETVRMLLDNGACPNMMADVGGTALHRAAWWDKLEVAHLLIARGANIDVADNRSDTPLHMAAKLGHLEMVRLLLDCGANPAIADRSNMTPHDWAQRNRRAEVAEYMVSRDADY